MTTLHLPIHRALRRLARAAAACALLAALASAAFPTALSAQALTQHIGYVDLAPTAEWFRGEARVEVNIKGTMLSLVAESARDEDPEFAALLEKLVAVQVRAYEQPSRSFRSVSERVAGWSDRLSAQGWETVLRVEDEDEHVEMAVRSDARGIQGMMVIAVTPGENESVFVNIVGEIDPAEVGRIGRRFRIRALADM